MSGPGKEGLSKEARSSGASKNSVRPRIHLGLWVLLPIVVFFGLNLAIQRIAMRQPGWYYNVDQMLTRGQVDYLLLGSSRAVAAVDRSLFEAELEAARGGDVSAANLARGNISLIHTVLALQRLAEKHPGQLRGTVLMLEIPGGLPPVFGTWKDTPRGWDSAWAEVGKNPQLLSRVLDWPHLVRFWKSPTDFEAKAAVTVRWATRALPFLDEQERVREELLSRGRKLTRSLLGTATKQPRLELKQEGGIRTDAEALEQIQTGVVEEARRLQRDTQSYGDWQRSLLPDLVRVADREGMKLVFYRIPQSSLLERASTTPVRLSHAHRFRLMALKWRATIVDFPFQVDDDDFPDGLHLRLSESGPFTRELVRSWLRDPAFNSTNVA